MKIFQELNKLGYRHYTEYTVEQLDNLPLDSVERLIEQSLAIKWFREKYNIFPIIQPYFNSNELTWNIVFMTNFSVNEEDDEEDSDVYHEIEISGIYEKAELACLKKLIEIVKNGN